VAEGPFKVQTLFCTTFDCVNICRTRHLELEPEQQSHRNPPSLLTSRSDGSTGYAIPASASWRMMDHPSLKEATPFLAEAHARIPYNAHGLLKAILDM
jgi:hypothetical protein